MSRDTFLGLWLALLAVMLTCRCLPLLLLRGRELPERVERALSLIPAAAFAALVANDLIQPDLYAASPAAILPVALSSVAVLVVACKSGSLLWCAVTGMPRTPCSGWFSSCYLDDFSRICRSLTHAGHMH